MLQNRVYWPGLRDDVRHYLRTSSRNPSSRVMYCLPGTKVPVSAKSTHGTCRRGSPDGSCCHGLVGYVGDHGEGKSVRSGNGGLFLQMDGSVPLPDKTALTVADAFFQQIVCRFGMPIVIHLDQGREFENKIMQELCIMRGSHKTKTTPYHPESDGMVEHFNRTLLMILAMFAGENRDDWDDLLPSVMMAYRSSVH